MILYRSVLPPCAFQREGGPTGTSDSPVTTPQFYSASYTEDTRRVANFLREQYPHSTLLAAGWSLGAPPPSPRFLLQRPHDMRLRLLRGAERAKLTLPAAHTCGWGLPLLNEHCLCHAGMSASAGSAILGRAAAPTLVCVGQYRHNMQEPVLTTQAPWYIRKAWVLPVAEATCCNAICVGVGGHATSRVKATNLLVQGPTSCYATWERRAPMATSRILQQRPLSVSAL